MGVNALWAHEAHGEQRNGHSAKRPGQVREPTAPAMRRQAQGASLAEAEAWFRVALKPGTREPGQYRPEQQKTGPGMLEADVVPAEPNAISRGQIRGAGEQPRQSRQTEPSEGPSGASTAAHEASPV